MTCSRPDRAEQDQPRPAPGARPGGGAGAARDSSGEKNVQETVLNATTFSLSAAGAMFQ